MYKISLLFAAAVAAASVAVDAGPARTADAKADARPNILFLLGDDWAYPHASCLGAPGIKTPTFDRLAREGVLFRNAHTAAPSCSPSRAAILTGQWHWRLREGSALLGFLPAQFPVYPDLLEKAGYHVGFTGKGYAPGALGDRKRNPCGPRHPSFQAFLKARPEGRPFCFWFGSTRPHRPYEWESGVKAGIDSGSVKVPSYLPDNETVRKDVCDYLLAAQEFDRQAGELIAELEAIGELERTLIVMTADNGAPFPRAKATCYVSGTHQPLVIRWGGGGAPGRVVDDFVSLADLAPTFLEAAGVAPPAGMTARSLAPVLTSNQSGQVDPTRDHVLTGMEVHVPCRKLENGLLGGYPMRSIVTDRYHYIRNFRPDRHPAGDPADDPAAMADYDALARDTFQAFADVDASPTKAFLVVHRDEPSVQPFAEMALGKRPARELYDLRADPDERRNLADDPAHAEALRDLDARLIAELKATGDPRADDDGDEFDAFGQRRPAPAGPRGRP